MKTRKVIERSQQVVIGLLLLAGLTACGGGASATNPAAGTATKAPASIPSPQGMTLTTQAASATQATLSWGGSTESGDKYQVYRNGELDKSAGVDADGAYDTGLAPGTQYCYQVTVGNSQGAGMVSSNQSCITTAPLAGWNINMITTAPPLSLALDPQGRDRLSFCTADGVVYQALQAGGTWSTVQVAPGANCFAAPLAVGGDGSDHIIYVDGNSNVLEYATDVSGSWSVSAVPGADGAEFYNLAVDSSDHVHVTYLLFTGETPDCYEVVYASNASGSWQSTVVASEQAYPVIAVDGHGAAYIAYLGQAEADGSYPVHYLTDARGSWVDDVVAESVDSKSLAALTVDPAGHAHIVYKSQTTLEYATDASGSWVTAAVDSFDATGPEDDSCGAYDVSIDLDTAGRPHLSYEDTDGDLKYATPAQSGWQTSYVDTEGTQNQIRMDAAGHAHVVYGNAQNLYSKLAVSP